LGSSGISAGSKAKKKKKKKKRKVVALKNGA